LTDSRRFTHKVVKRPSISLAYDRESSPARTDVLTTMLRQYATNLILASGRKWCHWLNTVSVYQF